MITYAYLKQILQEAYGRLRQWQRPEVRALQHLRQAIGGMPRYQPGRVKVWGWDLEFVDPASMISAFEIIVVEKWHDCQITNFQPYILDCGANIGISVLYFKQLFPQAEIVAFEPDPQICATLRRNLRVNNYPEVKVVEAALWDAETEIEFSPDGADGGRIGASAPQTQKVKALRLVEFLQRPVDLLKLDIEGAETRVILDCQDHLKQVEKIIFEYHTISGSQVDLAAILAVLERQGFQYYINSGARVDFHRPPGGTGWLDQYLMIYAQRHWH